MERAIRLSLAVAFAIGTFAAPTIAGTGAEPTDPIEPAATMEPMESLVTPDTDGAVLADARVIDLVATGEGVTPGLQFTQNGEQILDIPVTPGESVLIRVDNVDFRIHNFYIGTDSQLSTPPSTEDLIAFIEGEKEAGRVVDFTTLTWPTTDVGIPAWETGVQYVEWLVPADITDLKFGCTVTGHYPLMQGTFSVRA